MSQLPQARVYFRVVLLSLSLLIGCAGPPPSIPTPAGGPAAGSPAPVPSPGSVASPVASPPPPSACAPARAFVVPGSHGTVGGWLVDFASERNYMVNNVADHLDRLATDPRYTFALSEVPTLIAMQDLKPERMDEIRRYVAEGRVDLGNAFYLNSAVDLSGGEALVRLGIEGIRWQEAVLGVRPQIASLIDTVGIHRQMPQIVARLGLRGMVYTRNNPAGQVTHRWRSPDGSSVLAAGLGVYARWGRLFASSEAMTDGDLAQLKGEIDGLRKHDVPGAPTLLLAANGDYSGPPRGSTSVGNVEQAMLRGSPPVPVQFSTLSAYFEALDQCAPSLSLREVSDDAPVSYNAFWSNIPRVKQAFRRAEHLLQEAEMLATFGSLEGPIQYPTTGLRDAWTSLLLNMDRNTMWGAARGEVFESPTAWDVNDRFELTTATATGILGETLGAVLPAGEGTASETVVLFNPLSWKREDPVVVRTPERRGLRDVPCEPLPEDDQQVLCSPPLPPAGYWSFNLGDVLPAPPEIPVPETIATPFYTARIDARTGAIVSLRTRPTGVEVLAGPANAIVAERERASVAPGDYLASRGQRQWVGSSSDAAATVTATGGAVATTIRAEQPFLDGGTLVTITRFYNSDPRIDFETEIAGVPDGTLVLADFPLASRAVQERRGVPYGFSMRDPDARAPLDPFFIGDEQRRLGFTDSMRPAIRWSSYELAAGGVVALLDRGIPGREIQGNVASLHLMNAHESYRGFANPWLSGRGAQRFSYSLLVGAESWKSLEAPLRAWELNAVPWGRVRRGGNVPAQSWLRTSSNAIVESVRREGQDVEIRLVDWTGEGGQAEVRVEFPHRAAALTDFLGERATPLPVSERYRIPVAPQEIVTLRLRVEGEVPAVPPLLDYRPLAPPGKRPSFDLRHELRGHPPE